MLRDAPYTLARFLILLVPILLVVGHTATDIAISAIGVLFILRSIIEKDWRWLRERWVQCLLLLWAYMVVRGLFAEVPKEALHRALPFVRYIAFVAALVFWLWKDVAPRRLFFMGVGAVLLFAAADGLWQHFAGHDVFGHETVPSPEGFARLTGPFKKEILGIMLAWFMYPVVLPWLMTPQGQVKRGLPLVAGLAGGLFFLVMIVFSGERMALIFTLFGGAVGLLLLPLPKRYIFGAMLAGALVLVALAMLSPAVMTRQVNSTVKIFTHWQETPYGQLFSTDLKLAAQQPVFGIGANHFHLDCPKLYAGDEERIRLYCNVHPHNIYMEWLIEGGVVGFALFIASLAVLVRACVAGWKVNRMDPLFLGLMIAVLLRLWPLATSTSFFSPWGAPPFWLVLAALLAYSKKEESC